MAPKAKGKKGKAPKPDAGWEKTAGNFKWERPLESLPDPAAAPNFGEIRANLLASCKLLSILWSPRLDEAFVAEFFSTPRPLLEKLEFRGAKYLRKYVMSPSSAAPALKELDISCCAALEYVFIESDTLETISLARCVSLKKAHIVVRGLKEIDLHQCGELVDLMLWSDKVTVLNPPDREKDRLELYCPELQDFVRPHVKVIEPKVVAPPPVKELLEQDKQNIELQKRRIQAVFTGKVDLPETPYLGFNSYLQAI